MEKKTLQELTFKDNFMFAAVMMDEENAKGVLERALGVSIGRIEVCYEKSIIYNPEYKGVRLDVYIKDEAGSHFNVEMQVANREIMKRARYYHSQIDMELLGTGIEYEKLPECYVIFICDFDPIGQKKYKYTVRQTLEEDPDYTYQDGAHTVFLSTVGENEDEVPQTLVKFLKYAGTELAESTEDYDDAFVSRLQNSVKKIKKDREMGRRYMLFEELLRDEYRAGQADGHKKGLEEGHGKGLAEGHGKGISEGITRSILLLLSQKFDISQDIQNRITGITDVETLTALLAKVPQTESEDVLAAILDQLGF